MTELAFDAFLPFLGNFIGGKFVPVKGGAFFRSEDPGDLDNPVGDARGQTPFVDDAVRGAVEAFPGWRRLSMDARYKYIRAYQDVLKKKKEALALCISREMGKPLSESQAEVQAMIDKVDVTWQEALPLVAERVFPMGQGARGAIRHRPQGVVAVIGPFNMPGHLPNGQFVPALLLGNTVVFKPSELTPFSGQLIAQCMEEAELPPGVFQMVQGAGPVGAALVAHPKVNVVFFTGSAGVGRRIAQLCAKQFEKTLALEMGGKNAALVLSDASLPLAVREIVHGAFTTTGQIFVQKDVLPAFMDAFLREVDSVKIGYATDNPLMGPLVSKKAAQKFLAAQTAAQRAGFEAVRQGRLLKMAKKGHYVSPSVHLWPDKKKFPLDKMAASAYWGEEIFGPDAAVTAIDSPEEMARANNAVHYGLVASIFTRDEKKFRALLPELENGVVHWNRSTAMTPGRLPFGGVKSSGNHRPAGLFVPYICVDPVGSVEVEG
jgi:succinylglutamic semialdehyde dehydrogenase